MTYSALPIVLASALITTGCLSVHTDRTTEAVKTETRSIERGNAEMVKVDVKMSVGELRMDGGSSKLMDATFDYNVPFLKPVVRYDSTGFRGRLEIEQSGEREIRLGGDIKNTWDLRLNNDTPLDIILHMGAGESKLNFGRLDLRRVEVHMGVGELDLDLRGSPRKDYDVEIRGGVGEATIRVPRDAGVIAHAKGGIGEISVRDLKKDGSAWVNDSYGKSKVTVRLDIKGGIGQINLLGG